MESSEERQETRDRIDEERKHQMEVRLLCVLYRASTQHLVTGLHRQNYEGQEAFGA